MTDYYNYIASSEWKDKLSGIKMQRGGRCELCGSAEHLQGHHLTYEHLGSEPDDDILILCRDCHSLVHKVADRLRENRKANVSKFKAEIQHFVDAYADQDDELVARALYEIIGDRKMQNLNNFSSKIRWSTTPRCDVSLIRNSYYLGKLAALRGASNRGPKRMTKKDLKKAVEDLIRSKLISSENGFYEFSTFTDAEIDWLYQEIFQYYPGDGSLFYQHPKREDIVAVQPGSYDAKFKTHQNISLYVTTVDGLRAAWSYIKCINARPLNTLDASVKIPIEKKVEKVEKKVEK